MLLPRLLMWAPAEAEAALLCSEVAAADCCDYYLFETTTTMRVILIRLALTRTPNVF